MCTTFAACTRWALERDRALYEDFEKVQAVVDGGKIDAVLATLE
jgi:predicted solute-binding protein